MSKISIIVPVYNAEKYIETCIESTLGQTFADFELILIDDGSVDQSPGMCDEYAQKDARIKVIHQVNAGVSAARNSGLDAAEGEYVAFIDSDDWVDKSFLQKCLDTLYSTNGDLCITGFYFYNETVVDIRKATEHSLVRTNSISAPQVQELMEKCLISNIWAKLYRRSIIGDMRFDTSVNFGEDLRFCFEILKKDITVAVLDWAGDD